MREQARQALERYFKSYTEAGFAFPDFDLLSGYRANFLERFGPERLVEMTAPELLRTLPHNLTDEQPMDYWLEFKNDEDFEQRLFGSIAGGSASKYGTWQDKRTGQWREQEAGKVANHDITAEAASDVVAGRRTEILAAVEVLKSHADKRIDSVVPKDFQAAIEKAAPRWSRRAWFHKYLHLCFPSLVTWCATKSWSSSELYRLGLVPNGLGLYAQDLQIIRFWNGLPALSELPTQLRYRAGKGLSPREHWVLTPDGTAADSKAMIDAGYLALGPAVVGDLSEAVALRKKLDIQMVVKTAFQEAGLDAGSSAEDSLVELAYRLKEGSIIALMGDASTVIAVGEVTGDYRYARGKQAPHTVPVKWHHTQEFKTASLVGSAGEFRFLRTKEVLVAEMEASLIAAGVGPWPGFGEPGKTGPGVPSLEGIALHVSEMLQRKRQVILYGPPGTGKTYHAERVALELVARHNFGLVPSQLTAGHRAAIYGRDGSDAYIQTCTFHPMYAYEDFIEGYRPDKEGFHLEPGIFKRMVASAQARPEKTFVLVIDEINRGNIPKIFGELITLLEASKRGTTSCLLPLSKTSLTVPPNLFLIGTMNTADRSILLLDTALRRRFAFKELLPEPQLLRGGAIGETSLSTWLRALNRRIVEELGRDGRNLQVGHAYLMPNGKPAATLGRIGAIVRDEIWPLLQEYCYEDGNKLSKILASSRGGVYDSNTGNLRFELFELGREDDLIAALTAIVTPKDNEQDTAFDESYDSDEGSDESGDDDDTVSAP